MSPRTRWSRTARTGPRPPRQSQPPAHSEVTTRPSASARVCICPPPSMPRTFGRSMQQLPSQPLTPATYGLARCQVHEHNALGRDAHQPAPVLRRQDRRRGVPGGWTAEYARRALILVGGSRVITASLRDRFTTRPSRTPVPRPTCPPSAHHPPPPAALAPRPQACVLRAVPVGRRGASSASETCGDGRGHRPGRGPAQHQARHRHRTDGRYY